MEYNFGDYTIETKYNWNPLAFYRMKAEVFYKAWQIDTIERSSEARLLDDARASIYRHKQALIKLENLNV